MPHRLVILGPPDDGRAAPLARHLPPGAGVRVADVYTTERAPPPGFARALACPVTQTVMDRPPAHDWAVEVGFLPGVADNVGATAAEMLAALGGAQPVYTARLYLLSSRRKPGPGDTGAQAGPSLRRGDIEAFANAVANPLIHRVDISKNIKDINPFLPVVHLEQAGPAAVEVNLEVSDEDLIALSSKGIENRGPLGLSLAALHAIRDHFRAQGRPPRDIEVEMLAQSWSEHCKHTIFASPIDDIQDGLYRHYIKRATADIRAAKGEKDFCISVFTDNAGGIVFDDDWMVCDKVETHNSPCALEPFGGAVTGIGGVNRDVMGFGLGAKPIANRYGFCFPEPNQKNSETQRAGEHIEASAPPRLRVDLYRDADRTTPILPPESIIEGVVHGVEHGGNCSGIPTPQGFVYYDARCIGKPLVFVGTVGLIPRTIAGKPSHAKAARPGDVILMAGGRVGADGIHGATFSSVALDAGAPATAVQIGDPITQKKLCDALLEIRDRGWWSAITDNGAGGLSSSVGEMGARGFVADLDAVPLKYPGLAPWQIWVSESQERMTLAALPEDADKIIAHLAARGVEAAVIGRFTDSGRAVAKWRGEVVLDIPLDFVHDGAPVEHLRTTFTPGGEDEPDLAPLLNSETRNTGEKPQTSAPPRLRVHTYDDAILALLARPNIASRAHIATRFDHGVQGGVALGPLQGPGRVCADATVIRPLFGSPRGVVLSHGLFPRYGDIDTGAMAAASLDYAVRAAVAAGADPGHLALLDNFCWCSSHDPARLGQLKRACAALYEAAVAYGTPFISGKDSMFNDFKGYDADGRPVTISAPPTTLISGLGVIADAGRAVDLAPKASGDRLYLLGPTRDECGGSEYYAMRGALGRNVPRTDLGANRALYRAYGRAAGKGLIASALPLGLGGLAAGLAKKAIAGGRGLEVDLSAIDLPPEGALFSESTGRILVTVAPAHDAAFAKALGRFAMPLGHVAHSSALYIADVAEVGLDALARAYRMPGG
jgi:phosphoribosylformylglycinamidine synthase subunit PurSL